MSVPLFTHQTELSGNIVMLCRFLRNKGFSIGPNEEAEALQILSKSPMDNRKSFRLILKALLVKNRFQFDNFDIYFHEFWLEFSKAKDSKIKSKEDRTKINGQRFKQEQFESLKEWLKLNDSKDKKAIASYSSLEVLTKKDFSDLSQVEMLYIMKLLKRLARKVAHQKSRLKRHSKSLKSLDLHRTIRASMRNGGEIDRFYYSENKDKKLKLVLLCDVSRSMELYSRYFTHLIYAFQNSYDKIETFVFSTALNRVTEILNNLEFEKAFETISDRVPHWSGGTSIGSCLKDFIDNYSHNLIDKKTVVLILSDGWDTGSPDIINGAMHHLHKKSRKLIWLNPLAGSPNFSPEAIGLRAALPYIDKLCAAHNLESLKFVLHQIGTRRNLQKNQGVIH